MKGIVQDVSINNLLIIFSILQHNDCSELTGGSNSYMVLVRLVISGNLWTNLLIILVIYAEEFQHESRKKSKKSYF